jgi:hypothetical protein
MAKSRFINIAPWVVLVLVWITLLRIILPWESIFPQATTASLQAEQYLNRQMSQIHTVLGADVSYEEKNIIAYEVEILVQEDSEGNNYYVGVLSEELDGTLDALVEAYNAYAETDKRLTVEELRYSLTEGLTETIVWGTADNTPQLFEFFRWIHKRPYTVDSDGSYFGKTMDTNFGFIMNRSQFPTSFYPWELSSQNDTSAAHVIMGVSL